MGASALTVAVGQLFWKFSEGTDLLLLALGFLSYGIGSLLMVVAFRFGKLSVVHPDPTDEELLGMQKRVGRIASLMRADVPGLRLHDKELGYSFFE